MKYYKTYRCPVCATRLGLSEESYSQAYDKTEVARIVQEEASSDYNIEERMLLEDIAFHLTHEMKEGLQVNKELVLAVTHLWELRATKDITLPPEQ